MGCACILLRKPGATVEMAMDQCIQNMGLLASPRHLRGLVMVPFLALLLAFSASAQTNSDPSTKSTGNTSAQAQAKRGLASPKLKQFPAYLNRWDSQQARNEGVFAH